MEKLKEIYYNLSDPDSYAPPDRLQRRTGFSRKLVDTFVQDQDSYTLHRFAKRRIRRNHIIVSKLDQQWQADLSDMVDLQHGGFRYLLVCIDIYSRFVFAEPLRDKKGQTIVDALTRIFNRSGRKPAVLQTDKGGEFLGNKVESFLKQEHIKFFTATGAHKASIVERVQRTLKSHMWRYFSANHANPGNQQYIPILSEILESYNNRFHSSIGTTPAKVSSGAKKPVFKFKNNRKQYPKLRVGNYVRLLRIRPAFEKSHVAHFTEEIFRISKVDGRQLIPMYSVVDLQNETVEGKFYSSELQQVEKPVRFVIERILRKKKHKGAWLYFVKWSGYPNSFNSWQNAEDM